LMVCVQDNGPGIPEDIQSHLFDPFVSTKSAGKGLGLALVAKVIGDHGGIIEFESAPSGTLFKIMLPAASGRPEDEEVQ
jgi:two-component system nitrogen regulation sensor histidine kinase GlnL